MKKIVFVIPALKKTGLTEVLLMILSKISTDKFDVTVIALYSSIEKNIEEKVRASGVNVIVLSKSKRKFIRSLFLFWKEIRKINPDIIHYNGLPADMCYFFTPKKIKQVSTAHNIGKEDFVSSKGKLIGNLMNWIQLFIFQRLDLVIAVSMTVKKSLDKNKIATQLIYNGTNNMLTEKKQRKNERIFISTGSLTKRKNLEDLLRVFNSGKVQGNLRVVGDGPLREKYESSYTHNIKYVGFKDNVMKELDRADVFVSSSVSEGLPMGAIEAMSMNMPLVLSDISQHRELKKKDTEFIRFYRIGDTNELTKILNEMSKYEFYCSDTIDVYREFFTSTAMVKKYELAYLKTIGN